MRAIDAVTAHFKSLGTLHIDVPEWQVDGKPMRIFYTPVTIAEREKLTAKSGSDLDLEVLLLKAKDEAGKPLFTIEDKMILRSAGVSGVIQRVSLAITAVPTVEESEKNSEAIPS